MISVSAHIDINRTPAEVWSFLMDPLNDPLWQQNVVANEQRSAGPPGLGTTYRKTVRLYGFHTTLEFEISEFRPPSHCSVVITGGRVGGGGSYNLEAIDGGTRFTYGLRHEMTGLLGLSEPALRLAYPGYLAKDLANLKLAVETAREAVDDRRN